MFAIHFSGREQLIGEKHMAAQKCGSETFQNVAQAKVLIPGPHGTLPVRAQIYTTYLVGGELEMMAEMTLTAV